MSKQKTVDAKKSKDSYDQYFERYQNVKEQSKKIGSLETSHNGIHIQFHYAKLNRFRDVLHTWAFFRDEPVMTGYIDIQENEKLAKSIIEKAKKYDVFINERAIHGEDRDI